MPKIQLSDYLIDISFPYCGILWNIVEIYITYVTVFDPDDYCSTSFSVLLILIGRIYNAQLSTYFIDNF